MHYPQFHSYCDFHAPSKKRFYVFELTHIHGCGSDMFLRRASDMSFESRSEAEEYLVANKFYGFILEEVDGSNVNSVLIKSQTCHGFENGLSG